MISRKRDIGTQRECTRTDRARSAARSIVRMHAHASQIHVEMRFEEAAYRRGDLFEKRRRLMADWARYIGKGATPGARVVSLRTGVR